MSKKHLVVLSGAGVSADSGLKTFRDHDGLWEGHDVSQVATPEAWQRNPELVQRFYNERRRALEKATPNPAHIAIAELEKAYHVTVITQNVDDLHERAGSRSVCHLHGELKSARSSTDPLLRIDIGYRDIALGELAEDGTLLRPDIVWFGEPVPKMSEAIELATSADILLIVGTSLAVYPAASLVEYIPPEADVYVVDPVRPPMTLRRPIEFIEERAAVGVPGLVSRLLLLVTFPLFPGLFSFFPVSSMVVFC